MKRRMTLGKVREGKVREGKERTGNREKRAKKLFPDV